MSRPSRPTSSRAPLCSGGDFDWEPALRRLDELNARVEDPTLWDRPDDAQAVTRERSRLADQIEAVRAVEREAADAVELAELAEMEGDASVGDEAAASLRKLKERAARAELEALLSGEADSQRRLPGGELGRGRHGERRLGQHADAHVHALGHVAHGYSVDILEETPGEQAGIKSATLQVKGPNAYGWLKTESGVHRLVRISPYDSSARRHTSFASVGVSPVVDDSIVIDINPSDVRTDTYRASGSGGQHINKTDSAVRLTHLPTGIAVACQMGRSQHQNRDEAWKMLRARLYEAELQRREAAAQALADAKTDIGWGHQIRSYVLQPYQMVKDLRTEVETSDTGAVLDGDLDAFMGASLAQRVGVTRDAEAEG